MDTYDYSQNSHNQIGIHLTILSVRQIQGTPFMIDTPTAKAASPSLQDEWDSEVLVRTQSISVLSEPSDEGVPSPLLRQTL